MKTEELIEKRIAEEGKFVEVDGFAEYVSGIDDDELYILLSALEVAQDSLDDVWMQPLTWRLAEMVTITQNEFVDRDLDNNGYMTRLEERGHKILGTTA